jgi:hypothetical protein
MHHVQHSKHPNPLCVQRSVAGPQAHSMQAGQLLQDKECDLEAKSKEAAGQEERQSGRRSVPHPRPANKQAPVEEACDEQQHTWDNKGHVRGTRPACRYTEQQISEGLQGHGACDTRGRDWQGTPTGTRYTSDWAGRDIQYGILLAEVLRKHATPPAVLLPVVGTKHLLTHRSLILLHRHPCIRYRKDLAHEGVNACQLTR